MGIKRKKIMDSKSLSSMVEQQVKKMTSRRTKEADMHMIDNTSERPRGITSAYANPAARTYQQQFDNAATPNINTNPLPPHQEWNVNAIITVEERVPDFSSPSLPLKAMLQALVQESHLDLKGVGTPGFDWEICSFCDSEDKHTLFDCKVLRAQV
ncbi:hypothetical protein SO802_001082 [Lithocarpus litseifolius]|uniref:Reverse transcriptase zinc-binding domain-containing protein n=1 Tax=Lithocarpus litseifolius TaxID=425828 RepID=A0AAW2DTP4_9ROSI